MIIIPARLKSSRFENKILADFDGVPMFIKTAQNAKKVDDVIIAVDSDIAQNIADKYGFRAIMTDISHQSGTDRINEVVTKLKFDDNEIIINLQADEPFFESENLLNFVEFARKKILDENRFMASLYKIINYTEALDPNIVKVITNCNEDAIYFSRSILPYPREDNEIYKAHIGIYAYSVKNLKEFCRFKLSFLEKTEKLEQLRAIENNKLISMLKISSRSIGIDTKKDYEMAMKSLNKLGKI